MAVTTSEDVVTADEILKSVRRDINCLADSSKMTRKRALGNLRKVLLMKLVQPSSVQAYIERSGIPNTMKWVYGQ